MQTVISVLACLHIMPSFLKIAPDKLVYAFEELENNLHPSVIRRLMDYIYEKTRETDSLCFITTHSPVCIDFFGRMKETQIIHIKSNSISTNTSEILTYSEYVKVLSDIDAKASDLLQANGVIWVEGPSDRILLNRWLYIASGGVIKEGLHYVCAFYGGKLLRRLTAATPDNLEQEVPLIFMNRNMAIVMDSDRKNPTIFRYSKTKARIVAEVAQSGGVGWITQGKEIENYISSRIVSVIRGPRNSAKAMPIGLADNFYEAVLPVSDEFSKIIQSTDKIALAQQVADMTIPEDLRVLDLKERLDELLLAVRRWNRL